MDLPIYTAGSAEFLEMMLNASAMITGSGHAEDLAKIGAILGLVLIAFQAVLNNQPIAFQRVGVMLVLYMVFYGPTTTVTIEDTVSGQVRVVDNVSLGPAFVGSVLSTISYDISQVSEQAFSTPGMTQYGLFSSLTTLTRVRDALRNPLALEQFQTYRANEGHNLPKTLEEYLTFCTLNPVSLRNEQSIDQLYRAGGLAQLMSNVNMAQYLYVYDGSGPQPLKSCAEAKSYLDDALSDVYEAVLGDILNKGFAEDKASGRKVDGGDVEAAAEQALQSFSMSSKSAQEYVKTALVMPIFNDSRVKALEHWHEKRAAMALRESLNQQEIQWAGKGDSFKNYMRPMIAFFEGLLYAMTPFMAFALMLGRPGLSVLGKYLILPLAVGLWMPLLTIVNAFTIWYAGAQMESILMGYDATGEGFAMLQVLDMDQAITKALGVGGLLAASVPPLALFIVSGSSMVLNSVMGQATSAEKFRSEDVLPRASQPAPVLNTSPMYTGDHMTQGVAITGASQVAESLSIQRDTGALVQSTSQASEVATAQYQQSLRAAGQQLSSTSAGRQALAQIGDTLSASSVLSSNSTFSQARENLRGLGYTESSLNQAIANAALGLSTPIGGLTRSDSSSVSSLTSQQRSMAEKALSQLTQSVQSTDNTQLTFATGDAFSESNLAQKTLSNADEVSKSRGVALQAHESYSKAFSLNESAKSAQSMDIRLAAARTLSKGGSEYEKGEIALGIQNMAGSTEQGRAAYVQAFNSEAVKGLSTDINERRVIAGMRVLNQQGRLGELLTSDYSPFDFDVSQGDANRNHGLVEKSQQATNGARNLENTFASRWANNSAEYRQQNDMNISGYHETKESGAEALEERARNNREKVVSDNYAKNGQMDTDSAELAYDSIRQQGAVARTSMNLGQVVGDGANAIFTGIDTISHMFRDGSGSGKQRELYKQGLTQGLQPEEAKYFAVKGAGGFGSSQGAAYQELNSYYRSQGVRDEDYIAGAIAALDRAAIEPNGSAPTIQALIASRAAVDKAHEQSTSQEDVPKLNSSN
jgi:conjugal transfer mating pair stabilization protein TraG